MIKVKNTNTHTHSLTHNAETNMRTLNQNVMKKNFVPIVVIFKFKKNTFQGNLHGSKNQTLCRQANERSKKKNKSAGEISEKFN